MADTIPITLTQDEALIIEDALYELDESDRRTVFDEAQWTALWRMMGQLEKVLAEPFRHDYVELVDAAKRRITGY